jgi:hypothetical protein
MASEINTNIVKLRNSSNGHLPFKPMIMRFKHDAGISKIRRYRMVDKCKGKRK